ncbi:MAG: hypothetical protein ACREFC_11480 [Stellaceae bacterium]
MPPTAKKALTDLVKKVSALDYEAPEPAYTLVWEAIYGTDADRSVPLKQIIAELLIELGRSPAPVITPAARTRELA